MTDLFDNIVPLALILLIAFLIYSLGQIIFTDMERRDARYEQCLADDKQWVEGSCVK